MKRIACIGLLVVNLINSVDLSVQNTSNIVDTIVKTLDNISNQNYNLKILIKSFFENNTTTKTTSTSIPDPEEEECLCTPFYLCNNGEINTDGTKLLTPRHSYNPCKTVGEVCCEPYNSVSNSGKDVEKVPDDHSCGYGVEIPLLDSVIRDSTTAKFGEYPWTTALLKINNNKYEYQCVGSLIHPEVVLTSAHCVDSSASYVARVGEWNTSTKSEPYPHQDAKVKSIVKHPKFNLDNLIYNAALLFLEKPFKLNRNVHTVCLPGSSTGLQRSKCAATGWGMDASGVYSRVMKKIKFSLTPNSRCQRSFRRTRLGKRFELHETFVCGIAQGERALCIGDGGGPLVCEISEEPLRYQQIGITSWGLDCDNSLPSVFTKISLLKNWIDNEIIVRNLNAKYYTLIA